MAWEEDSCVVGKSCCRRCSWKSRCCTDTTPDSKRKRHVLQRQWRLWTCFGTTGVCRLMPSGFEEVIHTREIQRAQKDTAELNRYHDNSCCTSNAAAVTSNRFAWRPEGRRSGRLRSHQEGNQGRNRRLTFWSIKEALPKDKQYDIMLVMGQVAPLFSGCKTGSLCIDDWFSNLEEEVALGMLENHVCVFF